MPNSEHLYGPDWVARLRSFMTMADTSYSLIFQTKTAIYAARDPYGNRPLCLGKIESTVETCWLISSETCAFASIGAEFVRQIRPGEIVRVDAGGLVSVDILRPHVRDGNVASQRKTRSIAGLGNCGSPSMKSLRASSNVTQSPAPALTTVPPAFCIFEYIYFARADSHIEGQMVYTVRKTCGAQIFKESPVPGADIVACVPDTAAPAAIGFAEASGIPYQEVFVKNKYIGRSFIQPSQYSRKLAITKKFGPLVDNIKGKKIVIVDDSIVRGNTMPLIIKLLRESGAAEVHIRVASPPIKHACYMGVNIPACEELIANKKSTEELRE